ncbi:hypothetical protein [Chroococcidiopsis sp. SAG 2025]|uniref:hypothetical protein n=1 Tax=Chroococcidiopsis sp. SAG 2025 TaxID=171389 RepID=UPI002937437D|nr:hypothetical protein [Chroococcidiopsis sp. SAG 2025]
MAIAVVTNLLGANNVGWKRMLERSPQTTQPTFDRVRRFFQGRGNRVRAISIHDSGDCFRHY